MVTRLYVLVACIAATAAYLQRTSRPEPTPPRASFTSFPIRVGEWTGTRAPEIDQTVLDALGVTEFVNRFYTHGDDLVHLYIGYYASQREGSTIHSPMNCLPGAGWIPTSTSEWRVPGTSADVNRVVIQKGLDQQLVLYWYQSHGRIVASEYRSKMFLVLDSIQLNRTDAALVRVIAPFREGAADPARSAEAAAAAFAQAVRPVLDPFLPR